MTTSELILQGTITILSAIITTVVLPLVAQWLISKTNNQKIQSAITEITQLVATTVSYVEQTWVQTYKEAGTWDDEAKKHVLEIAIDGIIKNLSQSTTKWLEKTSNDPEELISHYVEAYIINNKQQEVQADENTET